MAWLGEPTVSKRTKLISGRSVSLKTLLSGRGKQGGWFKAFLKRMERLKCRVSDPNEMYHTTCSFFMFFPHLSGEVVRFYVSCPASFSFSSSFFSSSSSSFLCRTATACSRSKCSLLPDPNIQHRIRVFPGRPQLQALDRSVPHRTRTASAAQDQSVPSRTSTTKDLRRYSR